MTSSAAPGVVSMSTSSVSDAVLCPESALPRGSRGTKGLSRRSISFGYSELLLIVPEKTDEVEAAERVVFVP